MYTKLKAFISVAIISLSLFIIPVSLFLNTHDISQPVVAIQPTVVYAAGAAECGTGLFGGSILACVPGLYKMTIFWPSYFIIKGSGLFFDFFMNYSISSHTYASATELVTRGWAAVRDIANIFFIFVLLYIAIGTILNLSQVNTKKMLVKVIIIALLINFSLFFTRIIIDASNILAGAFAGSIEIHVPVTDLDDQSMVSNNGPQYSAGIISIFNPQTLLSTDSGTMLDELYRGAEGVSGSFKSAGTELAFILVVSTVLLVMSYVFIAVGVMLLGRVIELWYLMIISPIAFISIVLPFNIPKFGWDSWFKQLVSVAFLAPVFMFFMYLIIVFLNLGLSAITFDPSGSFWNPLLQMVIPFVIVLFLILKAKGIAEKMSGEIGGAFAKLGGVVAGLGMAAVSGGASVAMRATVGRAGAGMAASTKSGFAGRMERTMGKKLAGGSFDWRQSSGGQKIMRDMGLNTAGSGAFSPTGGHQGYKDRYQANRDADTKQRADNLKAEGKTLDPSGNVVDLPKDPVTGKVLDSQNEKSDLQQFEREFAGDIRGFDETIKKFKEDLSVAPESLKEGIYKQLKDTQSEYDDFKKGTGTYADKKYNGRSYSEIKEAVNTAEDHEKSVEAKVRQHAGQEIRTDFMSGLTDKEREPIASKVEGGGSSGGGDKKNKQKKPDKKEESKPDDK